MIKNKKIPLFSILLIILASLMIVPTLQGQVYYHIYLYVGSGSVQYEDLTNGINGTVTIGFHNLQFISGHEIELTALNTEENYYFANWGFIGYITGNSTVNPLTFYITSTFTLNAYFYLSNPEGNINFNIIANEGGTVIWSDLTTPNEPYEYLNAGSYVRAILDNLTFVAVPTQGYIFNNFTIDSISGTETIGYQTFSYTLIQDVNITANFLLSTNIPDAIYLESFVLDDGNLVLERQSTHILIFSCTESTDINPIGNISPNPLGTWFIEVSDLSNSELNVDSEVNYNYFDGGSIYNGQFDSLISLGGELTYSQWVLMRVNVAFSDEHMINRTFIIEFVPTNPTIPDTSDILSDLTNAFLLMFGNIQTDIVFIVFAVVCSLTTWKFALTGLIAGIGISTLLCTLAGLLPIWAVGLCIVLDITLIILGSGLLNRTTHTNNVQG